MWVEQSYKQVKHALGWSQYQVRSDIAIRRHWQLVCCAFSFCWWAYGADFLSTAEADTLPQANPQNGDTQALASRSVQAPGDRGKNPEDEHRHPRSWPEALRKVRGWLEPYVMLMRYWKAYTDVPPPKELRRLLERVFCGEDLYLYVR
jgi:hypothetical protein